ncbi:MAG: ParB N-terminal domain-containing protein, partial [Bifidobacteriaceae bacterium]|nr:ParB N-terminal domain-containing protein [Bifidobacteriaceae bacterium]
MAGEAMRHIRAVDQITVGARHRKDLGDLESLMASISRHGLLQPITVTPDGVLICGARRLEALRRLGVQQVTVWVRSGLSSRLTSLMAEKDENMEHKGFSPSEQAALYEELKAEIAADAARRAAATRFTSQRQPGGEGGNNGVVNFTTPWGQPTGDSRVQAAKMIGGPGSYATLEKVLEIQRIAEDQTRDPALRERAAKAVAEMDAAGKVDGLYLPVKTAARIDDLERVAADEAEPAAVRDQARSSAQALRRLEETGMTPPEMERAAREQTARVKQARRALRKKRGRPANPAAPAKAKRTLRAFVYTWADLADWPEEWDPAEIGAGLDDKQWEMFENTMGAGDQFYALARQA